MVSASSIRQEHTVPGSQALELAELMGRWGIGPAELLHPFALNEKALEEPFARVPVDTYHALLARARELSAEPALGIFLGLQRRLATYGFLGLAAMHASTLGDALAMAIEFQHTISTVVTLKMEIGPQLVSLRIVEHADAGDVRDIALLSFIIGMAQMGRMLTALELPGWADLSLARPKYMDRFGDQTHQLRFDRPDTRIVFDASQLDLKLVMPSRSALRLARAECERALALSSSRSMLDRVRRLICHEDGFRSLEEVAGCLRLSVRTLKRRLAEDGHSFSNLLEDERRERAQFLLRCSELSLEEISEKLGYSSLPNFARAFRRWTNDSPAAYRRGSAAEVEQQLVPNAPA